MHDHSKLKLVADTLAQFEADEAEGRVGLGHRNEERARRVLDAIDAPAGFPTVAEVAEHLGELLKCLDEEIADGLDVRLQVQQGGAWDIHTGCASFDTDHSGYWGASFLSDDVRDIAQDLIEQAADMAAEIDDLSEVDTLLGALRELTRWATTGEDRYVSKNPYGRPQVERALRAIAKSRGLDEEKWLDAND